MVNDKVRKKGSYPFEVLIWKLNFKNDPMQHFCLKSAVEYLSILFMISLPNYVGLIPGKLIRVSAFLSTAGSTEMR